MRAEADTRWAASARSVLEVFALRACDQPEDRDVEALLERVAELENRLSELEKNGVRAAPAQAPETPKAASAAQEEKKSPAPPPEAPVNEGGKLPKDVWNDALKYLKKAEPAIYGPLSRARYGGYQDGVYRALFAPGEEIFQTMLSSPARKEKIEAALNQCGGVSARFEAAPQKPQAADESQEKRQQQALNGLIDMFGRDKVQIDE